jgi:Sulfotransferase family
MSLNKPYLYRSSRYHFRRATSRFLNWCDHWLDPSAFSFFMAMRESGFDPNSFIDVLPSYRLIYVWVPKSASNTIKQFLSALETGAPPPPELLFNRRCSGIKSPTQVGISTFHRLANSAATLRFSFVRNPYARLVSAWADKYRDKPLIAGDLFTDKYREYRASIGRPLPDRPNETMSFAQFVEFAIATADRHVDVHWQLQNEFLAMPGFKLDFIGKVETFRDDFSRVLDHVGAGDKLREVVAVPLHRSQHRPWQDYYTKSLADRVHRAYESDFDAFGYPRAITAVA